MQTVSVNLQSESYPIYIGEGLLSDSQIKWPVAGSEVFIVSDAIVAPLYLPLLRSRFQNILYGEIILPMGENFKTLDSVKLIFDQLIIAGHSRKTTLIALGGGVIGDMTGFAAACYLRGVKFVQIPTTLLAQVDSAVGGKSAVNHPQGKNMIGAFHQPLMVLSDVNTLKTLPAREYMAGLSEVLKYALIKDADFFAWLQKETQAIENRSPETLIKMITRCCEIKAEIVSLDPTEQGGRAILNFGHTFAHALEQVAAYTSLLHGEAVAIGLCLALDLSVALGFISFNLSVQVTQWLKTMGLPTTIPLSFSNHDIMQAMAQDKKREGKELRFIVLKNLGEAMIYREVKPALITEILNGRRAC